MHLFSRVESFSFIHARVFSVQVVRRGLCERLRRGEERIGELWRVRKRTLGLGPASVRHQPAGDGDGHRHQCQECRDHESDDQTDLGDTDLVVPARSSPTRASSRGRFATLNGQDGVGLNLDGKVSQSWSQCSNYNAYSNMYATPVCISFSLPPPPPLLPRTVFLNLSCLPFVIKYILRICICEVTLNQLSLTSYELLT